MYGQAGNGVGQPTSSARSRRESITGPNETITANDAVDGIRRVAFARENSSQVDTPSKPKHTFKSRWQKVKTVIGVANKKLSTGMYEGCLDSNDFQRILDQWLKLCSLNKVPIGEVQKVVDEFDKRGRQASSKEVKAKLDLSDCGLCNEHVQLLCRVLTANPKIASVDLRRNPAITPAGIYTLLQLLFSQVDAARQLQGDVILANAVMLAEVLWDHPEQKTSPPSSSSAGAMPDAMLDTMLSRTCAELQLINTKNWVKRLFIKHGSPIEIGEDLAGKIFQKIVGKGLPEFIRCRQDARKELGLASSGVIGPASFDELEASVVIALRKTGSLKPADPITRVDHLPELTAATAPLDEISQLTATAQADEKDGQEDTDDFRELHPHYDDDTSTPPSEQLAHATDNHTRAHHDTSPRSTSTQALELEADELEEFQSMFIDDKEPVDHEKSPPGQSPLSPVEALKFSPDSSSRADVAMSPLSMDDELDIAAVLTIEQPSFDEDSVSKKPRTPGSSNRYLIFESVMEELATTMADKVQHEAEAEEVPEFSPISQAEEMEDGQPSPLGAHQSFSSFDHSVAWLADEDDLLMHSEVSSLTSVSTLSNHQDLTPEAKLSSLANAVTVLGAEDEEDERVFQHLRSFTSVPSRKPSMRRESIKPVAIVTPVCSEPEVATPDFPSYDDAYPHSVDEIVMEEEMGEDDPGRRAQNTGFMSDSMRTASAALQLFFDRITQDDEESDEHSKFSKFDAFQSDSKWRIDLQAMNTQDEDHELRNSQEYYSNLVNRAEHTISRTQSLLDVLEEESLERERKDQEEAQEELLDAPSPRRSSDSTATESYLKALREQPLQYNSVDYDWSSSASLTRKCTVISSKSSTSAGKQGILDKTAVLNLCNLHKTEAELCCDCFQPMSQARAAQIKQIVLAHNAISNISRLQISERFNGLINLDLSHNYLSGDLFGNMFPRQLQVLSMAHNKISLFKSSHLHFSNLKELNLSHNKIQYLEMMPTSLARLDVSHNLISNVGAFRILAMNVHLRLLEMSSNPLPATLHNLQAIKHLIPSLRNAPDELMLEPIKHTPAMSSSGSVSGHSASTSSLSMNSRAKHNSSFMSRSSASVSSDSILPAITIQRPQSMSHVPAFTHSNDASFGGLAHPSPIKPTLSVSSMEPRPVLSKSKRDSAQRKVSAPSPSSTFRSNGARSVPKPASNSKQKAAFNTSSRPSSMGSSRGNAEPAHRPTRPAPVSSANKASKFKPAVVAALSHDNNPRSNITERRFSNSSVQLPPSFPDLSIILKDSMDSMDVVMDSNPEWTEEEKRKELVLDEERDVEDWLEESRRRIVRCKVLMQEIVDLANIQQHLSASTLRSMQQEWHELGFYDNQAFVPLRWPTNILPFVPNCQQVLAGIADEEEEELTVDEQIAEAVVQLADFHKLFLQINTVMQLCCSASSAHPGISTLRPMLKKLMQKGVGLAVNQRLHFIYELRDE